MIIIKDEIRNFKNEKNKVVKKEIADLIIEEANRLLNEMNNVENKVQCEVTGEITHEGTQNEMKCLEDEMIRDFEEELEEVLKDLKLLDSENYEYFDGIIKKIEEVLIYSKI